MNDSKADAEEQLNVGLQEAVTTGQIVVQVTDDSDPPQPIADAQVIVTDGTIITDTTNADGEVTLEVSVSDVGLFATKEVTVTVTPPDGYTLSEQSTQTVTAIAVATIDVNLVLQPFSLGSRTLQVVRAGPGSGTVSSVPTGISCGEDCSEVYPNSTPNSTLVTLTATPVAGSVFSGWSGGGCSGTGPCTVTMDQNRTIIANFGLEVHTLQIVLAGPGSGTVSSAPAGISCGEDCSEVYPNGTQVTLTATPATGSVFSGWSGSGCSGSNPQCILTMDRDHTVTATFTLQQFVLQVTLAGNGTVTFNPPGITCDADCSEEYSSGTQVTLTADPGESSSFAGWSGAPDCSADGSDDTCTVTITQDSAVTATFTSSLLTARCREILVGTTCGTSALSCISLRIPVSGTCQGECAEAVAESLRAEGIAVLGPSANLPAGFPPACVGFRPDIGGTAEGAQCLVDFLGPPYRPEDPIENINCRVDGFPYNVYLE